MCGIHTHFLMYFILLTLYFFLNCFFKIVRFYNLKTVESSAEFLCR